MNERKHGQDYYAFRPISKNPIRLDFTGCRTLGEVHLVLKKAFGLPESYGENWDALWDCLDGLFLDAGNITVEISGYGAMEQELRDSCSAMLRVFRDVRRATPNVTFRLVS